MLRFVSETTAAEAPTSAPVQALDAAIEKRRSEWAKEAKASKPETPASQAPAEPATEVDKATPADAAPVSGEKAARKDKSAKKPTPEPAPTLDLSWLPEQFHSPQSRQSPEFFEWAKGNVLRQKDYTQKTQDISKREEEVKAVKDAAEKWRRLEKENPQAATVAWRLMQGESFEDIAASLGTAKTAEAFSYLGADDPDIDKRVESLAMSVFERAEAEKARRVSESEKQQGAVQEILVSYIKDNAVDPQLGFEAIQSASAALAEDGLAWTTSNAERVLKRHLKLVTAGKPATAPTTTTSTAPNGTSGLSKVASHTGQGVGASAPAFMRSQEFNKRWSEGALSDEQRAKLFWSLRTSRRGQDEGPSESAAE